MAENTNSNETNTFQKQKNKEEMQKQLITFALMILFTIIAFAIVATGAMESMYVIPVLLILAITQVGFQLYYFMHMKDKNHNMPAVMMYGGLWAALLTLAGLGVITWW
ncbi:cytochrome c oxidase subunit IVB [Lentibacillus sp. CBA3610]|uniref:cytochrome c oxidase subunit IVB n=1 Tax=Lentibacillus sp. CBA3610 TaxID=2518176 RepID=UPI0015956E53|nr:cytochrome c oxidase subunit IVB [Lentibacillus sp. CBA3610]QKY68933.1 cytochrome c oxidase subunit IVB [Lentibacillus sp. CBA3610]